jgi:hypothetical protein
VNAILPYVIGFKARYINGKKIYNSKKKLKTKKGIPSQVRELLLGLKAQKIGSNPKQQERLFLP